jgi:hypothetical protein
MDPLALKFGIQVNYASPQENVPEAELNNRVISEGMNPYDLPLPTIQLSTLHHDQGSCQ